METMVGMLRGGVVVMIDYNQSSERKGFDFN